MEWTFNPTPFVDPVSDPMNVGIGRNYKVLMHTKPTCTIVTSSLITSSDNDAGEINCIQKYMPEYKHGNYVERIEVDYIVAAWISGTYKTLEELPMAPAAITVHVTQYQPCGNSKLIDDEGYVVDIDHILSDIKKFDCEGDFGNGIETPYNIYSIDYTIISSINHPMFVSASFMDMQMKTHPIVSGYATEFRMYREDDLKRHKNEIIQHYSVDDDIYDSMREATALIFDETDWLAIHDDIRQNYPEILDWYDGYIRDLRDKYAEYNPNPTSADLVKAITSDTGFGDIMYLNHFFGSAVDAFKAYCDKNCTREDLETIATYLDNCVKDSARTAYGKDDHRQVSNIILNAVIKGSELFLLKMTRI